MWNVASADLEQQINQLGLRTVMIASIILVTCTVLAIIFSKRKKVMKFLKLPLFLVMASTLIISTAILFGGTIYLNTKAESKGPVHWHSDIEFWVCGTEMELRNPFGFLSNKIGTATYHEHNDKRIHLEGVVVKKSEDASLKKFMAVTGGYITENSMGVPLNENSAEWLAGEEKSDGDAQKVVNPESFAGYVSNSDDASAKKVLKVSNGMRCYDQKAELQTFVFTYNKENDMYSQTKLDNPSEYIMRNESNVPPGDCVIVEFDVPKKRTNKLCEQYGVRDATRCQEFGVEEYNPELCNLKEVEASQ